MKIVSYNTARDLAAAQAETMIQAHLPGDALRMVMISGGSTPRAAFEILAENADAIPSGLQVLLSDERVVPLSDSRSNAGWISALLVQAGLPPESFTYIHCEKPESDALETFEADLDRLQKAIPSWTDAFLGMGSDGHTCGLFSIEAAQREDVSALAMDRADGLRGISVTRRILKKFDRCILAVSGEGKAERVRDLVESPDSVIAGQALKGHSNVEIWGDLAALRLLSSP
jgi:6-phosphogluconolactonase/glucosamine-6-phosphate isomerase/deaminase